MPSRVASLVLPLLLGACTRVPAEVSTPSPEPPAPAPTGHAVAVEPIPEACNGDELATCAASCSDSACLEWCGGRSCATTLIGLWSCMDEAERRFAAEHPRPMVDLEDVTDEQGITYQQPTAESLEREYDWQDAYTAAIDQRWAETCRTECTEQLADSPFCDDWLSSYHSWARLSQPPPEPSSFGLLSMSASFGVLGSLSIGTAASLTGPLAESIEDPHVAALAYMVSRVGWQLGQADGCVTDLPESGREFMVAVELDQRGSVIAAELPDDPGAEGECVANLLADALVLPIRVAREFPQIEVRVQVKPLPDLGWGDLGLQGAEGWYLDEDYGGLGIGGGGSGGGAAIGGGGGGGGTIDLGDEHD